MTQQWFDVDVKGLGALMERRGKPFAVKGSVDDLRHAIEEASARAVAATDVPVDRVLGPDATTWQPKP